jgi:pilus assembly protein Flp/PilA
MNKLTQFIKQFLKEEEGMAAVEYALIVAIMATAIIAAWGTLAGGFEGLFESIAGELSIAS